MKYIIEIDSKVIEDAKKGYVRLGEIADAVKTTATPYNPSGDFISREALRKTISGMDFDFGDYYDNTDEIRKRVCEVIDNAQTVPERDYSQGWHDAITKALNEAYTITTEDGSFKVVQTETLEGLGMSMSDKKGEWKTVDGYDGDEYYECSNCGEPWVLYAGTPEENNMNFCPNCGADMKGGAE